MINLAKVESLLTQLETIEGLTGAIMASVTWSYGCSLANMLALRERLDHPDSEFARLKADVRRTRAERMEKRIEELESVLAWATAYANPEYTPSGKGILDLVLGNDKPSASLSDDEYREQFCSAMGITEKEASALFQATAAQRAEQRQLIKRTLEVSRELMERRIDAAIAAEPVLGDLTTRDTVRILERIAEKCEVYEGQRLQRAALTRRTRRLAQLAAERRLLADIANKADELAARLAAEAENEGPEELVPERHNEAA